MSGRNGGNGIPESVRSDTCEENPKPSTSRSSRLWESAQNGTAASVRISSLPRRVPLLEGDATESCCKVFQTYRERLRYVCFAPPCHSSTPFVSRVSIGMPAGGSMFEKVLKRLCPCYYNRKKKESIQCQTTTTTTTTKKKDTKQTSSSKSTTTSSSTGTGTTTSTTSTSNTENSWKGTLNLVQPQPIYAFPLDLKKSVKKKKNLLKPPLYWKKATKTLHPEGPPVFQESRNETVPHVEKKPKKKKMSKGTHLKHSETVANLSSATFPSTVDIKSRSLEDLCFDTSNKKQRGRKKRSKKQELEKSDLYWVQGRVLQDFSQGAVCFTAAYFNEKKTCMINVDRLENLSRKGRDGNSYYSVVKIAVLPSEKYVKCSKILANCSSPEVKQSFSFSVRELAGKVLRFSVFDASLQKMHEAVGHALLTLEDIAFNEPKKYRVKLYKRSIPHICPGNLALGLKYKEAEDKFTVVVEKARNLTLQKEKNVKLNTYVKVSLYSYGEKVKTKKSIVVVDSRDPNYNSAFTFQIRKDQLDYSSVTIAVRLKGFVNDITIGRLNFGPFFYVDYQNRKLTPWGRVFLGKELVSHWFRMYL